MRALLIFIVLAAAAIGTWNHLLKREQVARDPMSCPVSATGPAPQALVSYASLESVVPSAPSAIEVGVLNATNRRGLAAQVTTVLQAQGFTRATTKGNDLLYPPGTMHCHGQIRFGPHGAAAARSLALVMPCAQLINDHRQDSTVDLVLGTAFSTLEPNPAARTVLAQLEPTASNPTQPAAAVQPVAGPATPGIPESSLAQAHQANC